MKSLYQISLKSILHRKLRFFITLFTVALGVSLVFSISILNTCIREKLSQAFIEYIGDAHFIIKPARINKFNKEILEDIKKIEGIKKVDLKLNKTYTESYLYFWEGSKKSFILFFAIDTDNKDEFSEFENRKKNFEKKHKKEYLKGRFFSRGEKYSVIISDAFSKRIKKGINDKIQFYPSYEMKKNEKVELKIIGIRNSNKNFVLIPFKIIAEIPVQSKYGSLYEIQVSISGTKKILDVEKKLNSILGNNYFILKAKDYGKAKFFNPIYDLLGFGLSLISFSALIAGIFLIWNIFSVTVQERMREFGILRAVGATKVQVFNILFLEGLMFGIFGSIIGIFLGFLLSKFLIKFTEATLPLLYISGSLPFKITMNNIFLSFSAGVFATLISVLVPAISASSATAIEQMRKIQIKLILENKWTFYIGIFALILSFPLLHLYYYKENPVYSVAAGITFASIATIFLIPYVLPYLYMLSNLIISHIFKKSSIIISKNNLSWNKHRTIISILAISFSVQVMIIMSGLETSSIISFENLLERKFGVDGFIYVGALPDEMEKYISDIPEIQDTSKMNYILWNILGEDTGITFFDIPDYLKLASFVLSEGQEKKAMDELKKGKAVLVSYDFAKKKKLKVGDKLPIQTEKGVISFKIAGISYEFIGTGIVGSFDDMKKYFGVNTFDGLIVKFKKTANLDKIENKIIDALGFDVKFISLKEYKKNIRQSVQQITVLFKMIFFAALIITGISIFNILFLNVLERKREIGILRTLGLTQRDIFKIVILEGIIICISGSILGLFSGLYQIKGTIACLEQFIFTKTYFVFPTTGIILSISVAIFLAIAGSLYPARHSTKIQIIDALRYE